MHFKKTCQEISTSSFLSKANTNFYDVISFTNTVGSRAEPLPLYKNI